MKKQFNIRITETALALIKLLQVHKGVSQAAIVEMSVREMAKREKIVIPKGGA